MIKKPDSSVQRSTRALALALAVVMGACPGTAAAQPSGIPAMGAASGVELSPALERTLGDAIMEQGRRDPSYVSDPDVNQYLTAMGRGLARHAPGASGQSISVFALRDAQINAFALPGGHIGINSGLVVAAQSESELASVVAHEIGHVAQRHIARGMTQSSQSSHIMLATLAGALLAALAGSGDLAMGVAAFGQAAAVDRQLGFSRQAEQEADRAGYEMMRQAGYDPRGMLRMFQQLSNASRLNEGAGGNVYTSTHPLSVQRMADIESRLQSAAAPARPDDPAFWFIRAKLRVMQARDSRGRANAVAILERDAGELQDVQQAAAWYGLAYEAWSRKDYAAAREALSHTGPSGAASPEVAALRALVAIDSGEAEQGLRQAQEAWARWPQKQGVALALVHGLGASGQHARAVTLLQELIQRWPEEPRLHQLLAQGYETQGQHVEARRAMARYYELTGALPTAVEQLRQARGMANDFYLQSELDVEIRNLKDRLVSERELLERFKS